MTNYTVNIYLIADSQGKPRLHLSNPALYVTPDGSSTQTATFTDPTADPSHQCAGNAAGWYIYFKDSSPFCTMSGGVCTQVGQDKAHPITQNTGPMYLTSSALQSTRDYNYTIEIDNQGGTAVVKEDPQVIIGGKGRNSMQGAVLPIAAGVVGFVIGILAERMFAGQD